MTSVSYRFDCGCDPEHQVFCDTGYALHRMWSRAEMLAYQYHTRTGLKSAKRAWENHLKETGR